jgi:NADH dehydrogenase (ubiquinone) 1 beta subcomplex subunit 10
VLFLVWKVKLTFPYSGIYGKMPGDDENNRSASLFNKFYGTLFTIIDAPVTAFREKVVEPAQSRNKLYYYHRRYRRVPTIDECDVEDPICYYEANEQYRRDKQVEDNILAILRQRRIECEHYHGHDASKYCQKVTDDYLTAETNWFIKYGDIGPKLDVKAAYMKQKHRMIWERRHGPVGSGMKTTVGAQH